MSKGSGYVPIDKNLIQELNNISRSFTRLEAMFSYTVDRDNGKGGSINGYAGLWNWSRNKTRKFLKEIRTVKGHSKDSRRTPNGHPVHFIDKALWVSKDSERTVKGHSKDSERDTTNNPNPFLNPNPILKSKEKDLKPFIETSDEVRPCEVLLPAIHFVVAQKIAEWVKGQKNVNITNGKITIWANQVRLLIEKDLRGGREEKEIRINETLEWFLKNADDQYTPVVECGSSFRKKFTKIEAAMKKDEGYVEGHGYVPRWDNDPDLMNEVKE